jgi:isopenicillin-N N-acyltransferase-like protein
MRHLVFEGSCFDIGRSFGEECRSEIAELYDARMESAIRLVRFFAGKETDRRSLLDVARRSLAQSRAYAPAVRDELRGIAEGAGRSLGEVWAMNGLTDLLDVIAFGRPEEPSAPPPEVEGCSSFILPPVGGSAHGGICGQSWDLGTENLPYVLLVTRRPTHGLATTCLTTVGCLSLIGMNEAGLAVGTTNIRTTDSRPGVGYLEVIHCALGCSRLSDVERVIRDAPRAGAHYYYAMNAESEVLALECSAAQVAKLDVYDDVLVHSNHCLAPSIRAIEAATPRESTEFRANRLKGLLQGRVGGISVDMLKAALSDHEGGDLGICRHDAYGVSSNGSVIMLPSEGRMLAVHGQACAGEWVECAV